MRIAALAIGLAAIVAVACGNDERNPGNGAGQDAEPVDASSGARDAASSDGNQAAVGAECDDVVCDPAEVCCVDRFEQSRSCSALDDCRGVALACDGPEDCTGADEVCCTGAGGSSPGSQCEDESTCPRVVCHEDGDCPGDAPICCELGTSEVSVCVALCPQPL